MAEERATGERRRVGMDAVRVTAFTDGLFVVAATLLVVAIDIPNIPNRLVSAQLPGVIDDILPQLFSYFLSFAVIVIFWFRHHDLFGRVHTHDAGFVVLNMVFLAFIAVLPFPTELIGKYGEEPITVVIYAINVLILSGMLTVLYVYSERRRLVDPAVVARASQHRARAVSVFIVFGLSIPLAYVDTTVARYTWLALFILPRLITRLSGGRWS
jgi:uncharacterized membrane protein